MKKTEIKVIDLDNLSEFEELVFESYKRDGIFYGAIIGLLIGIILGFVVMTVSLIFRN